MTFIQNLKNRQKQKKFLKEALIPIILLALYFILFHFQKIISLPSQDKFMALILDYINHQSLLLIFLIALLEGGFILGQYAPGGVVLFLSIVSAGGNVTRVVILTAIISIAFLIAYSIDYLIGYHAINRLVSKLGFEKQISKFQKLLDKSVFSATFFTYWDTNLASILSVAAGSLKISFRKFIAYSILFVFFWNIFWSVLLFFFGNFVIQFFGQKYLMLILVIWLLWVFYHNFIKQEEALVAEAMAA